MDRGFLPLPDSGTPGSPGTPPPPPGGPVSVTGWLRTAQPASRPLQRVDGTAAVTAVDPAVLRGAVDYPLLAGYVQLSASRPAQSAGLTISDPPGSDPGPYLSYAVQWLLFSAIAVVGLAILALDELGFTGLLRRLREERDRAPGAPAAAAVPLGRRAGTSRSSRPVLAGPAGRTAADLPPDFFDDPPDADEPDTPGGPDDTPAPVRHEASPARR